MRLPTAIEPPGPLAGPPLSRARPRARRERPVSGWPATSISPPRCHSSTP